MPPRLRYTVIIVVTFIWAANFLASVFIDDYTPSESINGIFMVVVGGLYAIDRKQDHDERERRRDVEDKQRRRRRREDDDEYTDPSSGRDSSDDAGRL